MIECKRDKLAQVCSGVDKSQAKSREMLERVTHMRIRILCASKQVRMSVVSVSTANQNNNARDIHEIQ